MTAAKPFKGIPFKPMRQQLRGQARKLKPIKENKRSNRNARGFQIH